MSDIVALSGRIGSGKDFIYNQYLFPLGYRKLALADHFKIWIVGQGLATYDEVFKTKPEKIRHILQQTGTEEGRNIYGADIWCQTAFAWIEHLSNTMKIDKWCITDVRFKNEVLAIQKCGGRVIRINEVGCDILGHIKEEILGKNWFDCYIPERSREEFRSVFHRITNGEEGSLGYYENLMINKKGVKVL